MENLPAPDSPNAPSSPGGSSPRSGAASPPYVPPPPDLPPSPYNKRLLSKSRNDRLPPGSPGTPSATTDGASPPSRLSSGKKSYTLPAGRPPILPPRQLAFGSSVGTDEAYDARCNPDLPPSSASTISRIRGPSGDIREVIAD